MIVLRVFISVSPNGKRLRKRRGRLFKPVKPSHKVELWYKQQLLAVVAQLRKITGEELLPELKRMEPLYAPGDGITRDAKVPRRSLESSFRRMAQRAGGIEQTAKRLAALAAQRSAGVVDERLSAAIKSSVSVDISPVLTQSGPILDALRAATKNNIDLIKSIPEQYFEKLGDAVGKNMERGMRFEDLAKEIERIGDVTESRAKLIARDQASKMNGAFNEARQTSLGIDKYQWQTSGDERVRPEHAENDGKVFSWNDPPLSTGHPGHDVLCRCVAIPCFDLDKEEELLGL